MKREASSGLTDAEGGGMMDISSAPHAADAEHRMIYEPADALGFTAWTDCFDYQNGRLGLSFKEIRRVHDAAFVPPRLEMGEAIGAPVITT